jgi:hypothetical protein
MTLGLATRTHAPDSCHLRVLSGRFSQGRLRVYVHQAVFRCGCPAVTDGLDGFCLTRTISAAEAWTPPPEAEPGDCSTLIAARFVLFAPADRRWRRRSGSVNGSGGVRAVAAARAARRTH